MADTLPNFSPTRRNILFRPVLAVLFLLDYLRNSSKKNRRSNNKMRKDESDRGTQLNETEKPESVREVVQ
jgi:hypothetical protein